MKSLYFSLFLLFFTSLVATSQEITETNSDVLYAKALEAYKDQGFTESLKLTNRGLEIAPGYHDIRILQIRNLWALKNYSAADLDLDYLLEKAPNYVAFKPIVLQRINLYTTPEEALVFIEEVENLYPSDIPLQVRKAQLFLDQDNKKEARSLAMDLMTNKGISGADRYNLQIIINRSVTNEIGVNYQYIGFSEEYTRSNSWHTISAEYQRNFNRTAVIGRMSYSDRSYDDGTMYELEAYPVFNERFYAFANLGFSTGNVFPDARTSLSLFYNFAKIFEAEAGGRMLFFNENGYFTGILGLTMYSGKFYFNARTFLGPERVDKIDQNYQGNIRYYFGDADNYIFMRIGSGISPDESVLITQVIENPDLNVYFGNLGINKRLGIHHVFQISGGVLYEDITAERQGTQLTGNLGYRYRF